MTTTEAADSATAVARGEHIADPAPLGLAAFATTTFVLSCFNAGLFDAKLEAVVLPLAMFYGGISQFAAGMWEFRKGNTFGSTAFGSYGMFWVSFAFLVWLFLPKLEAEAGAAGADQAVGLFLLAWTIFTLYMLVASFRTNGALVAVFAVLLLTFIFLTVAKLGGSAGAGMIGGYLGIVTAVLAWYTSAALVINSTAGKNVLPLFARG